jgi:sorbitol-specific phosphotransferase system component IIC
VLNSATRPMFIRQFIARTPLVAASRRFKSNKGVSNVIYDAGMKSAPLYISYILVAAVAVELIYGKLTTTIWETMNKGVGS